MMSTPATLLDRLRQSQDAAAWERFVELYSPLLFAWAKRLGQQDSDAADLVQDVFLLLWRKLPEFDYDPSRSFHGWLRTLFLNEHRRRQRARVPVPMEDAGRAALDGVEAFDEPEYRQFLIRQAYALIATEFPAPYQAVFREYVLRERPPEEVAREFKISPGTVYGIKSRILNRLRRELRDLVD